MSRLPDTHTTGDRVFNFFFLKSVPATIWIMLLVVFGAISYEIMIKESLPDLEIPQFHIVTVWEGATPEMVEKEVTQKIEKELRGMKGLKKMYSSSITGRSIIAVTFEAEYSISESMQLVQRQMATAKGELPKSAETSKVGVSAVTDLPVVTVALFGTPGFEVREKVARDLKRKLQSFKGIQRVVVTGGREKVVQITLLPNRLKALGIASTSVRRKIMSHGFDAPWGTFENRHMKFSMKMDGVYDTINELKSLVIARLGDGHLIRLDDVAEVEIGHLRETVASSLSNRGEAFVPVIALDILKMPGQDTIDIVGRVKHQLESYSASQFWPEGLEWELVADESEAIVVELDRGFNNGWQAMLAVFIVLFVLLSWREALVAALSIPITVLGAVAVLWMLGYTFNMLVIVGIILALGLLVDDFILIMEGMHEGLFIEQLGFADSVRRTIKTYAVPSFSGSITTILVLVPLVFVGGVDGKFIRIIPVTAMICLIMSYIISIFVSPSLLRMIVGKKRRRYERSFIDTISHRVENLLSKWIGTTVIPNKKRALLWCVWAFFLFVFSLGAASLLRDTLYPKEDGRSIGISVELAPDTTLQESKEVAAQIGERLRAMPYIQTIIRVSGGVSSFSMSSFHDYMGVVESPNRIGFSCYLVPGRDRDKLAYEFVPEIRKEIDEVVKDLPGARFYINAQAGGPSGEDPVQIDITGEDMTKLRYIALEVGKELSKIKGVVDVRNNIGPERLEMHFRPMHEAMDHFKIDQSELGGQMVAYMENEKVAKFRSSSEEHDLDIRLGTKWSDARNDYTAPTRWEELARLSIINQTGDIVPLWGVAEPVLKNSNNAILRTMGQRSVTVLAKLDGAYVSEVISKMRPKLDAMNRSWGLGYSYSFSGEDDVNSTYINMLIAFCIAMVLVYAVLALLFDSLLYPGIILSTVGFALTGVFLGFMLGDIPFSFTASIGIVALVGIVVNDAIIMVETIRNHRRSGLSIFEAAKRGSSDRLRPIISTTVTNFAGLTPLALSDPGWAPLCQAIIFGELTATIGAVVLIPALYVLLTPQK